MNEHELPDETAELLSAMLDGAVTEAERAEAEAWLQRSSAARTEYEALARVRTGLRELPAVDPPAGFFERMVARTRPDPGRASWWGSPAALVASGIATAAAWAVLGGAGGTERLVPPIDDVQAAVLSDLPLEGLVDVDRAAVTVVRQEGAVDWAALPAGARSDVDGSEVWVASGPGPATVVVERDGAVYTLVSEEVAVGDLLTLVDDLPSGGDGLRDQVKDACETLVDVFAWD